MRPLSVRWSEPAQRDLRRLDRRVAERIRGAIRRFAETGHGDVTKLEAREELRLGVGAWRVLFVCDFATETMLITRVLPSGRAYDR